MPWVEFSENFDFQNRKRVTTAYRGGERYLVSEAVAEAAITAGKAKRIDETKTTRSRRRANQAPSEPVPLAEPAAEQPRMRDSTDG